MLLVQVSQQLAQLAHPLTAEPPGPLALDVGDRGERNGDGGAPATSEPDELCAAVCRIGHPLDVAVSLEVENQLGHRLLGHLSPLGQHAHPRALVVELGPLPDNVHVEAWVAQADVAAEASVIVGHGGYGATLGALAAGVPLAVLPLFADQPYNARRVAEAGAGVVAAPARPLSQSLADPAGNGAAVARSVQQLLESPRHREAAADIAAEVDSLPAVDAAVGVLESAAREALAVA